MVTADRFPIVLTRDGGRDRPVRVDQLPDGTWRVNWIGGLVSLYDRDPREHLRLGYEPKQLRRPEEA
jgi:hypothetical protein